MPGLYNWRAVGSLEKAKQEAGKIGYPVVVSSAFGYKSRQIIMDNENQLSDIFHDVADESPIGEVGIKKHRTLTDSQKNKLARAIQKWSENHSYPDEPSIIVGGRECTPR